MSAMMAPLVIPMTSCEANCAGSRTACTSSRTSKTAMSATAMRDSQLEDLMLWIRAPERDFVASTVVIYHPPVESRGPAARPVPAFAPLLLQLGDVENAVELELTALDRLDGELREGRVAVLVEAPGTENALVVLC